MAAYLLSLERYDEARSHAREAFALSRELELSYSRIFAIQHLAAVAAMRSDATSDDICRAARLLGFIEGRLEKFEMRREYTEQHTYDALLSALRRVVDEAALAAYFDEGRAWTEERAFEEAQLC
jgi:hypothetical protein